MQAIANISLTAIGISIIINRVHPPVSVSA